MYKYTCQKMFNYPKLKKKRQAIFGIIADQEFRYDKRGSASYADFVMYSNIQHRFIKLLDLYK